MKSLMFIALLVFTSNFAFAEDDVVYRCSSGFNNSSRYGHTIEVSENRAKVQEFSMNTRSATQSYNLIPTVYQYSTMDELEYSCTHHNNDKFKTGFTIKVFETRVVVLRFASNAHPEPLHWDIEE